MCRSLKAVLFVVWVLSGPPGAWAQTVTLIDNMSFGITDVASNPPAGTLQMGTNGSIAYGTNLSGTGTGIAGKVQLAGTTGQSVEVRCSATATLAKSGGGTLALDPVKASLGAPQTYGAATDCAGVTVTVLTGTLSATATDNIVHLGGELDTNATTVHGTFSTSITGGTPITVSVIFL